MLLQVEGPDIPLTRQVNDEIGVVSSNIVIKVYFGQN